ncbi:MAG: vWA domain-containing protein [Candidatus Binataceae bacterium]
MTVAEEIGLLAVSVVVVAMILFWIATRAHLDEEDPEREKPGFRHGLRQSLRFLLGPFPLSIGLHVVVLLFLLFAVHMETGESFIPISLQAGGGGGQTKPGEDTNLPEMQMPDLQALPLEKPKQIDAYAREAVTTANNYVRSTNSGIGIGRGGGMGSGYGQGIGSGFGGFISGLRRTGLDVVIVIDGTGSMRLVIGDVKDKMRELMFAIHRLVPTARIGVIVFGGRGEQMQMQPLTTSTGALVQFLSRIRAQNGGEWQENTLGAIHMAVDDMGWRSYAKKVIVLVGDTPPFKDDFDPTLQLIRQFRAENGTFNTVDLTVEEHERFVKQWQSFSGPVPVTASALPEFYLETQAAYQAMARAGGGSWRSLTKDSHINQQVLILAFGDQWKSEVAAFGRGIKSTNADP